MKTKTRKAGRPSEESREAIRQHLVREARRELLRTGGTEFRLNQVLKAAGGSKTTLYTYFGGRNGLLEAVLKEAVEEAFQSPGEMTPDKDLKATLLAIAHSTYQAVLGRETMALYRMAICEAKTAPVLAEIFFASGPAVARHILTDLFTNWSKAKKLKIKNPSLAADIFFGMLLEGPVLMRILMLPHTNENLEERAEMAVTAFIKAHT